MDDIQHPDKINFSFVSIAPSRAKYKYKAEMIPVTARTTSYKSRGVERQKSCNISNAQPLPTVDGAPLGEEMALSISIALSGLERTDFTNYEKLFDRGEEIVNRHLTAPPPPPPIAPSVRQRSSSSSSESTFQNGTVYSPSACSQDSQSSTIKRDSSEWYPPPLSLRDYCMFRIDMAESDTGEKFKMLEVYDSAASSPKPKETEEAKKYIMRPYEETSKWSEVQNEIRWENRNLLDLGSNLKGTLNMFQPVTYLKTESLSNHPNSTKPRRPCKNCGFKD